MSLTVDEIQELLKPKEVAGGNHASEQIGPLRLFDREMTCTSRRCNSPTFLKIQGVPLCMMHALKELNEMLVEAGFKGVN